MSTWVGIAIGVITSAVGFRFLDQIVDISKIAGYSNHYGWFIFVDVLLTGAILADGSKTIHRIFALYDTFMESTRERADSAK